MGPSGGAGDVDRAPVAGLGLGERLRSARKARALSVAKVAEELRLEEPIVLALEEGRFEALGAPVFVRGHLKRYAALVGLSADAVLQAYRAAAPESDAPPAIARAHVQRDALAVAPWVWWAIAGVVAAIVLVAFLSGGGGETPPAVPVPAAASPLPEPLPLPPEGVAGEVPPGAPPPPGTAP